MKKDLKIEELIEIIDKVDDILHDHGYIVDHDILGDHIIRTIKESYPNEHIELGRPDLQ